MTLTSTPRRSRAPGREPTTSARPPVFENGTTSELMKATFIQTFIIPPDRRLDADIPEERGGLFGGHGIYIEPRAPLEAGHARDARDDLEMPVVVIQRPRVQRARVDQVVIGGIVQRRLDLGDRGLQGARELRRHSVVRP